jgi:hypothetical protein
VAAPYRPSIVARSLALTGGGAFTGDPDIAKTQADPDPPDQLRPGALGPLFRVIAGHVHWAVIPAASTADDAVPVDGQGLTVDAVVVKRVLDKDGKLLGFVRVRSTKENNGGVEPGHHFDIADEVVERGDLVYLSVLGFTNPGAIAAMRIVATEGMVAAEGVL